MKIDFRGQCCLRMLLLLSVNDCIAFRAVLQLLNFGGAGIVIISSLHSLGSNSYSTMGMVQIVIIHIRPWEFDSFAVNCRAFHRIAG